MSSTAGQDQAPTTTVDAVPTTTELTSAPSLALILGLYPILEKVFPCLNQYDLNSLRATSQQLQAVLPSNSILLGATCRFSSRPSCTDPKSVKPLRGCFGYKGPTPLGQEPFIGHEETMWACPSCVWTDISFVCNLIRRPFTQSPRVGARNRRNFIPVCDDCFDSRIQEPMRDTSRAMIEVLRKSHPNELNCKCTASFEADIRQNWLCFVCARHKYKFEVVPEMQKAMDLYLDKAEEWVSGEEWMCGSCEKLKSGKREIKFWMCAVCEWLDEKQTPVDWGQKVMKERARKRQRINDKEP